MEEVKNRTSENTYRRRVDVIIPTYKPGKKFSRLLKMLERQTYPIGRIIVMNTEKELKKAFAELRAGTCLKDDISV